MRKPLGPHAADLDVHASVNVVEQIPPDAVGILIDDEIVGAVPAPIGANRPIPGRDCKGERAGQPEAVMIAIEAFGALAVGRAKMLEATVLERTVEVITLLVRPVVAEPVVLVDVRRTVHGFGLGARILCPGRRGRNATLVGAGRILPALLTSCARTGSVTSNPKARGKTNRRLMSSPRTR